jgi:uncharacterized protein
LKDILKPYSVAKGMVEESEMRRQRGEAATKFEAPAYAQPLRRGRRNPKHEIHPPKAGKNSNDQNPNVLNKSRAKTLIQVVVLLLGLALCLSACAGKTASSKFYVLSSLPQSSLSAAEGATIGVFPVAMPDYLDRPQIVTRASDNEIKLDEFSRWGEPLKDSFTRALVQNLSTLLNTAKIVKTTESTGFPMALQVGVEVMQFDGTLGGDVVLIVKWGLFGEEGKKLLLARRSTFKEPTGAATYEALVAAESRAVAALSREIAEAIRTRK